jgi:hypothetical protein
VSVCLLAIVLIGCNIDAAPGRFTYVVKYEVTAEFAATSPDSVDIDYEDEMGTQSPAPFVPPQSFEFTMNYDYDTPFNPQLTFNSANFAQAGDRITLKIIWKDYRTNFREELLSAEEIEYSGAPPSTLTLYGPPLPH